MHPILARAASRSLSRPAARHIPGTSTILLSRSLATKIPKNKLPRSTSAPKQSPKPPTSEPPSTPESTTSIPPAEPPTKDVPPPAPAPHPTELSLDFSPPDPSLPAPASEGDSEHAQRTGARSSKDSLSSIERKRRMYGQASLVMFAVALAAGGVYLGREWEEGELEERRLAPDAVPNTRWGRTKERFTSMFDLFSKPQWSELLPPMLPAPYQKPYTLLVSVDDLLVTSTWDRQHGWRTAKRPGVDYFLAYLSQFYEVVVFTTQYDYTAAPIVEKLDPYNFFVTYRIYRQGTRASENGPVKDLTYLNRPLDRVILLDAHEEHVVPEQRDNAIVVPPWKGKPGDRGLVELIPFLESIGIYKPPDVRPILSAYQDKDIAVEYAKKEAEAKRKFIEDWESKGGSKGVGGVTLSGLFSSGRKATQAPETYLEAKRREAQALYLEEQKYIRENKAEFERLLEQDRQAAEREMSANLFGSMGALVGGPPQRKPDEAAAAAAAAAVGSIPVKVDDGQKV
ncbi:HAD-like protein [Dentipellis sp. KUC8613]|nr:HAD-like protein [Dentipellis sp. KUC8613]